MEGLGVLGALAILGVLAMRYGVDSREWTPLARSVSFLRQRKNNAALFTTATVSAGTSPAPAKKPAIVLVHGAFAESSSWNPVIKKLLGDGYKLIAVAIPLRA
jgi:hypothetical protein